MEAIHKNSKKGVHSRAFGWRLTVKEIGSFSIKDNIFMNSKVTIYRGTSSTVIVWEEK